MFTYCFETRGSCSAECFEIFSNYYTAKNATDLLQVVNFTCLLQLVNKLQQACQFHQVAANLLKLGLLQLVLFQTCYNLLKQVATYLLRFVETPRKFINNKLLLFNYYYYYYSLIIIIFLQ